MADRREQILARLLTIAETLKRPAVADGFVTCARNRGLLQTEQRPAFVLMDGGEQVRTGNISRSRNDFGVQITLMRPELYVLPAEVRPTGKGPELDGAQVGTTINGLRQRLTRAIAQDNTLLALLGSNGGIHLETLETDLVSGGAMSGEMKLNLVIAYVFDPSATP